MNQVLQRGQGEAAGRAVYRHVPLGWIGKGVWPPAPWEQLSGEDQAFFQGIGAAAEAGALAEVTRLKDMLAEVTKERDLLARSLEPGELEAVLAGRERRDVTLDDGTPFDPYREAIKLRARAAAVRAYCEGVARVAGEGLGMPVRAADVRVPAGKILAILGGPEQPGPEAQAAQAAVPDGMIIGGSMRLADESNRGVPVFWSGPVLCCAAPAPGSPDSLCGYPVESEPCPEHAPEAAAAPGSPA